MVNPVLNEHFVYNDIYQVPVCAIKYSELRSVSLEPGLPSEINDTTHLLYQTSRNLNKIGRKNTTPCPKVVFFPTENPLISLGISKDQDL